MARPPDSSTPASQCLPHPRGESKLELMPTEVLEEVFCHLSQNDLQSYHDLQDKNLVKGNRSAHTNMSSLCLTSKRVDAVARPLLFRIITVSSPAMLVRLYETLLEIPDLGSHIRQISFEILTDGVKPEHFLDACSSQGTPLLKGCDSAMKADGPFINRDCCDQILSSYYFEVLRRTPKVHRLVIRIQPTRRISFPNREDGQDVAMPIYMYQPFFRRVRHAVQASPTGDDSEFLPQLKSLELLGDPNDSENMFDIAVCEPLLRIHTLRNITTFRDNGFWSAPKLDSSDHPNPG